LPTNYTNLVEKNVIFLRLTDYWGMVCFILIPVQ